MFLSFDPFIIIIIWLSRRKGLEQSAVGEAKNKK